MTEQEKLAFELAIRQKVAEENRAKQRESKARWREKNREYLRACEHYRRKSIRIQNGVADSHRICQYSLDGEFINVYESSSEAAKKNWGLVTGQYDIVSRVKSKHRQGLSGDI